MNTKVWYLPYFEDVYHTRMIARMVHTMVYSLVTYSKKIVFMTLNFHDWKRFVPMMTLLIPSYGLKVFLVSNFFHYWHMSCSSSFIDGHNDKGDTIIAKTFTKSANMVVCISCIPESLVQ